MEGFVEKLIVDVVIDVGAGDFGYNVGCVVDSDIRGVGLLTVSIGRL